MMGMVKVWLAGESRVCDTEELLRLARDRNVDGGDLDVSPVGSPYPLLTVFLKRGLAAVLRLDQDPLRPGGEDGTAVFVAAGDGSVPVSQKVDFVGQGGPQTFFGDAVVSDTHAMAILRAFADNLEWPKGVEWITQV